jgi:hypothetical protein
VFDSDPGAGWEPILRRGVCDQRENTNERALNAFADQTVAHAPGIHLQSKLPHRVVVTSPACRVDGVPRPTRTILHTHDDSLPCTLVASGVEVAADRAKQDGAQLLGVFRIELRVGGERLGDDDAEIVLKRPTLVSASTSTPRTKRS